MEEAGKLRRAAYLIEVRLGALPPTPWEISSPDDRDGADEEIWVVDPKGYALAAVDDTQAAEWIVLSPVLLRMFGEYLEDLAHDAEEIVADARAVAIAEVVIAALGDNG